MLGGGGPGVVGGQTNGRKLDADLRGLHNLQLASTHCL